MGPMKGSAFFHAGGAGGLAASALAGGAQGTAGLIAVFVMAYPL